MTNWLSVISIFEIVSVIIKSPESVDAAEQMKQMVHIENNEYLQLQRRFWNAITCWHWE